MRALPAGRDWCPECEGDGKHTVLGGPAVHTHDAVLATEYEVPCHGCGGAGHVEARLDLEVYLHPDDPESVVGANVAGSGLAGVPSEVVALARGVPHDLARQLLVHGSSAQVLSDGYEAYRLLEPYWA